VGDVTIELARMVDLAQPGQIYVGDFQVELPEAAEGEGDGRKKMVGSVDFLSHCSTTCSRLLGIQLSGEGIAALHCGPSLANVGDDAQAPRRFRLTDKHGISRSAYNLGIHIETVAGRKWELGLADGKLPPRGEGGSGDVIDENAIGKLKQRSQKSVTEE
jgi:hypothetical protein